MRSSHAHTSGEQAHSLASMPLVYLQAVGQYSSCWLACLLVIGLILNYVSVTV